MTKSQVRTEIQEIRRILFNIGEKLDNYVHKRGLTKDESDAIRKALLNVDTAYGVLKRYRDTTFKVCPTCKR